jgi:hypothetical protein
MIIQHTDVAFNIDNIMGVEMSDTMKEFFCNFQVVVGFAN